MEFRYIPLENLTVATINARTHGVKDGLESLTASIRAQGLLQPLLVRPATAHDGFEIVAGQRRFLACLHLAQEAPVEPLPCFVLAATDDAAALEISLAENVERLADGTVRPARGVRQAGQAGARGGRHRRAVRRDAAAGETAAGLGRLDRTDQARGPQGRGRDRRRPTAGAGDAQATKSLVQAVPGPGAIRAAGQPAQGVVVRRRGDCDRGGPVPAGKLSRPDRRRPVRRAVVFRRCRAVLDAAKSGHRRTARSAVGRGLGQGRGAGNRRLFPKLGVSADREETRAVGC